MPLLHYQRARFVTRLPEEHLYTASHSWLSRVPQTGNRWRVGYTKFALRMLGEIVDVQVGCRAEEPISPGAILGSIEGFKAVSDIYSAGGGRFVRGNPGLAGELDVISQKPYDEGWLYEFDGEPEERAMDVQGYRALLDQTIDRLLLKEGQTSDE